MDGPKPRQFMSPWCIGGIWGCIITVALLTFFPPWPEAPAVILLGALAGAVIGEWKARKYRKRPAQPPCPPFCPYRDVEHVHEWQD